MIGTHNRLTVLTIYKISGNKADYVNDRSNLKTAYVNDIARELRCAHIFLLHVLATETQLVPTLRESFAEERGWAGN